ncbi:MAG: PKD domain-containing protein [Bacteroidetes bacterium]|nr:MAG: PKD domain-containing protein [Bacteroidota bacterium]
MKRYASLAFIGLLCSFGLSAQVANDDCFGATPLGTLGTPAACPSGIGAVSTFNNLTNVNSVTEQPYTTLINCQPSNNTPMASPATDVWFSFVNSGNELNITINGNIVDPNIAVYQGNCNGLIGRGCAIGSGNTLTANFDQMVPGQTYYIQVSGGAPADQGTFTMTLQNVNSCNDCLLASNLTVNPAPTNGTYQGGTTVTFCYTITQWDQQNTNWLHAVIPNFGSGWDMSTLTNLTGAATCDGGPGVWQWFNNVNTPNGNGILTGFFFDGDIVQGGPNGNPTDNFGDNCQGTVNWTFCWTITANTCPPGQTGDDLGIIIDTYGDGETGNWTNIACVSDPVYQFNSQLTCCVIPQMVQNNPLCNGGTGSATVTGMGVGPWDYVWEDASSTVIQTNTGVQGSSTANNLPAGTYTVTVTDNNDGCVVTQTITITEPTAIQLTMGSTPAACGNNNGTATCTPSGGAGGYIYQWDPAANNQTTPTASNLGSGLYQVTVTDANGCSATAAVNVGSSGGVTDVTNATVETCANACDGTATVVVNGGQGPYVIQWSPNANNQTTPTATNLCPGTYTVTYTDANNCTGTNTVTVTGPAAITSNIAAAPTTICIGQNTTMTANAAGGAGGPYGFAWLPAGTGNTASVTVAPVVTTTYTVTVTDANNCSTTQTITITVNPALNVQAVANPTSVCSGQPTTLTAVGGGGNGGPYTYTWAPAGTGSGVTVNVSPTQTTTYTVTIDDNCTTPTATAVVTVTVNPLPAVAFSGTPLQGCAPLPVTFTNLSAPANNPTCLWDFGDGSPVSNNCNPTHIYTQVGCFDVTLTYTDDNGCVNTVTMQNYVCTFPVAVADFSASPQPTTIFNPTISFTDLSLNATAWTWYFGVPALDSSFVQNPSFTFVGEDGGCYDVVLMANNASNCPDIDTMEVCIDPEFTVYFPNAFTPNGDLKNDGFTGYGTGILKFEIWIFDRWGNLLYYSDDIYKPWDGKVQGKSGEICQEDVYVWKAVVTDIFEKKHKYIGHVTLIK